MDKKGKEMVRVHNYRIIMTICHLILQIVYQKYVEISFSNFVLIHWGRDELVTLFRQYFKCIFLNENIWISINISLKFVHKGPTNNIPTLPQIMACRRLGEKPLSEPMMASLLTHICVTRPQWVITTEIFLPRSIHMAWQRQLQHIR